MDIKVNPFHQDYMGELSPYSLMLMCDKNGRCIRLVRRTHELEFEFSLQMVDSNDKRKHEEYSYFVTRSFEFRIPEPELASAYWSQGQKELGLFRWTTTEWLEREDPLVKEIWMPQLPNWLNAAKILRERAINEWIEGLVVKEEHLKAARKDMPDADTAAD